MSATTFLESIRQDLKYGIRTMCKYPAFSLAVILTIALGIGANTAMFSVIHAVLLKPLSYYEPDRVVLLSRGATLIRYNEMKAASQSYTGLGAYSLPAEDMALSGVTEPEVLSGVRVSGNFLRIFGVTPLEGRDFRPDEDVAGAAPVAMISAELWQRRFAGNPQIIGTSIMLAGEPHT